MAEIGDTLREARMKARIDVSELEAQTKIRAKYLRALENEEWSLLPGPTFVKSFLRTYAQALGLDGRALVEEYRLHHERPSEAAVEPIVARPPRMRVPGPRLGGIGGGPSRGYMIAVGTVTVLIVVLIVALLTGGGGSSKSPSAARTAKRHVHAHHHRAPGTPATRPASSIVALSLHATARVYVCLIGEGGRKLLPGTILQPGASTPTFHARHFLITLGNSGVRMLVDGRARAVPESGQAIGYSITRAGRRPLAAGKLPTCA
jgi:cytoskeleton protein RodZ